MSDADARFESFSRLVAHLAAGITNLGLYGPRHTVTEAALRNLGSQLGALWRSEGDLRLLALGDDLFLNTMPMRRGTAHASALLMRLRKAGVQQLRLSVGMGQDELATLLSRLAESSGRLDVAGLPHATLERVRDDDGTEPFGVVTSLAAAAAAAGAAGLDSAGDGDGSVDLGTLNQLNVTLAGTQQINMETIESVVFSFLTNIRSEVSPTLLLGSIPSVEEYALFHQRNVCILGLQFARYLSVSASLLVDFGAALMLHDAGKLMVPPSLLNKTGTLSPREWTVIKLHPITGANMLLRTPNVPPLAVVAALEHHVQYDMQGYPALAHGKRPNLCSQICGLCDFYDALRCERPFRAPLSEQEIAEILLQQAGKRFDGYLVQNFLRMLGVDA